MGLFIFVNRGVVSEGYFDGCCIGVRRKLIGCEQDYVQKFMWCRREVQSAVRMLVQRVCADNSTLKLHFVLSISICLLTVCLLCSSVLHEMQLIVNAVLLRIAICLLPASTVSCAVRHANDSNCSTMQDVVNVKNAICAEHYDLFSVCEHVVSCVLHDMKLIVDVARCNI